MRIRVDGDIVAPETIWWPEMNFGQFRWAARIGAYELELPRAEVERCLRHVYQQCVAELKEDDRVAGADDRSALREAGYPPLAKLFAAPAAFEEVIRVHLYTDLFEAVLPPVTTDARFMINSIESVSVSPEVLLIRGRGYYAAPGFAG